MNCHVARAYHLDEVCLYVNHVPTNIYRAGDQRLCSVCARWQLGPWRHNVAFRVYQKSRAHAMLGRKEEPYQ